MRFIIGVMLAKEERRRQDDDGVARASVAPSLLMPGSRRLCFQRKAARSSARIRKNTSSVVRNDTTLRQHLTEVQQSTPHYRPAESEGGYLLLSNSTEALCCSSVASRSVPAVSVRCASAERAWVSAFKRSFSGHDRISPRLRDQS